MKNSLFYGDNLDVLKDSIGDDSIDLVYLDPPFNSNANYNILFKDKAGANSQAQLEAFEDTWEWGHHAEDAFDQVVTSGNTNAADVLRAMRLFLGENDMMAYISMMSVRLIELHRVLKQTGSLYLHCDPTASHYLKLVCDSIFGIKNFRNEIIWKRKAGRGETNKAAVRFGVSHDVILFYAKSSITCFQRQYRDNNPEYIESKFRYTEKNGRRYRLDNLTSPSYRKNLIYSYKGYEPPEKGWAVSLETMEKMDNEGRLHFPVRKDMRIQRKRFLDELQGETVDTIWDDISPINSQAQERLGYPTQKPIALLERIIEASTGPDAIVLDPFCGCGTAVHAAQKLGRKWIGIDITHLAVSLIERRMRDAFPNIDFTVHGTPKDLAGAIDLANRDKYQFQWWAVSLVNAFPFGGKKKGADGGIDGVVYFKPDAKRTERAVVQVKGGQSVGVGDVKNLRATIERDKTPIGLLLCLSRPTKPMIAEAAAAGFYETMWGRHPRIQILTVEELMSGKRPNMPLVDVSASYKRAAVEQAKAEQISMFD